MLLDNERSLVAQHHLCNTTLPENAGADMPILRALSIATILLGTPLAAQDSRFAQTPAGKPQLLVDGKPFLVLGIQLNNSSGFPALLGDLAPAIARSHANIVMAPVGWESIEPEE